MNHAAISTEALTSKYPANEELQYRNLILEQEVGCDIRWHTMHFPNLPCFTLELIDDICRYQRQVRREIDAGAVQPGYLVLASDHSEAFNLGGDLGLFVDLIKSADRAALEHYARECIRGLYPMVVGLDRSVTTIALVQGQAMGGGFEVALANQVIVAERSATFALPEILFNLFPGMGAYSLLARRINPAQAERIILSGRVYSAQEMYDLGIVDVLAEDGAGDEAVREYVRKQSRRRVGTKAVHRTRQRVNPVTEDELIDITLDWVDSALQLEQRDLKMMSRLVRAQRNLRH